MTTSRRDRRHRIAVGRAARIVIDAPAAGDLRRARRSRRSTRLRRVRHRHGPVAGPSGWPSARSSAWACASGCPYRTDNTVVEFEEGRLIAWCHFNRHRWRYELEPLGDGSTLVTETFDGRTALVPAVAAAHERLSRTTRSPWRGPSCGSRHVVEDARGPPRDRRRHLHLPPHGRARRRVRRDGGSDGASSSREQPGFLDMVSVRDPVTRVGITVAYFVDEDVRARVEGASRARRGAAPRGSTTSTRSTG